MSSSPDSIIAQALQRIALASSVRELWSYDDIAAYSKYEKNFVVNDITQRDDFPTPIRIGGERGHPRYIAGEVMAWFEAHRST